MTRLKREKYVPPTTHELSATRGWAQERASHRLTQRRERILKRAVLIAHECIIHNEYHDAERILESALDGKDSD